MYLTPHGVIRPAAPPQACHRLCRHLVSPLDHLCHCNTLMDRRRIFLSHARVAGTVVVNKVTVRKTDTRWT